MKYFGLLALLVFLLGCTTVNEVSVSLSVVDGSFPSAFPVDGATATFVPENDSFVSSSFQTNMDGVVFGSVPSGTYAITVSKEGYSSVVLENQDLTIDYSRQVVLEALG